MSNAKEEFISSFINEPTITSMVKCAGITHRKLYENDPDDGEFYIILYVGYTAREFDEFLDKLDFNYNSGYGSQELFGVVWLEDGTWATRGEYDGSEWWEYHKCPDISSEYFK